MSLYLVRLYVALDFPLFRKDSARKYFAEHNTEAFGGKEIVSNVLIHITTSELKAPSRNWSN